jgi:hypothetical protein
MNSFRARLAAAALATAALAALPRELRAAEPPAVSSTPKPFAYGVFIGSNGGGPGQTTLRYAESDARTTAQTLRDVGRYGATDMRVLAAPSPAEVLAALDVVGARLREHEKKGEQALLVFYFSGHAKANALHLGDKELDLGTLRDRLRGLPSTLTLIVLDTCQSGAFARTKGAEPAADFSTNSVARLQTRGTAVLASSTSQELSQESDELRSSYFTHHLLVALRGAGDQDRDGRVTLDEAYRYAYRRTLASTERTKVGGQHATLETELSGQGDLAITYPRDARSQLLVPSDLAGRVLVIHKQSGSIVAELQKVAGAPLSLALPAGDYDAMVRIGASVRTCSASLVDDRVTALVLSGCSVVDEGARAKGDEPVAATSDSSEGQEAPPLASPREEREIENWKLELGFGNSWAAKDAYTRRLEDFGYRRDAGGVRLGAALMRDFGRYVALGVQGNLLPSLEYRRTASGATDTVEQSAFGVGALARLTLPFLPANRAAWFETFVQATGGIANASLKVAPAFGDAKDDSSLGPSVGGAVGIAAGGRIGGGFLSAGYDYAPVLDNRLGDTHNVGGAHVLFGARLRMR